MQGFHWANSQDRHYGKCRKQDRAEGEFKLSVPRGTLGTGWPWALSWNEARREVLYNLALRCRWTWAAPRKTSSLQSREILRKELNKSCQLSRRPDLAEWVSQSVQKRESAAVSKQPLLLDMSERRRRLCQPFLLSPLFSVPHTEWSSWTPMPRSSLVIVLGMDPLSSNSPRRRVCSLILG